MQCDESFYSVRTVVRKHEVLQRNLEKAEENLSAKADAKETLQKNVRRSIEYTCTCTCN